MEAKVKEFAVEEWMDTHETTAKYNIAETCVASISLNDLQNLSEEPSKEILNLSTKLTYGSIRGSDDLRSNLARLYSSKVPTPLPPENVLITPGAIAANLTVFYALIRKGNHVICHYPTYQHVRRQITLYTAIAPAILYEVPASLGADVSLWRAQEDKERQLDMEELKALIRPETKMIIINNPQNPTGAILTKPLLQSLITLASSHDPPITILSDEVYRPLFHTLTPISPLFPPSILSLSYPHTIATGSLSKAYSLAGIRIGWIASRSPALITACAAARQYITISVSQLDDRVASFALSQSCIHRLLARNLGIARTNVEILAKWIEEHRWACRWTRPVAGTTAFVRFEREGRPVDDVALCERLHGETGVLLVPGSYTFGEGREWKGYVRFGFYCETELLREGLEVLGRWMREGFGGVPVVD